jgi:hypothetical protein
MDARIVRVAKCCVFKADRYYDEMAPYSNGFYYIQVQMIIVDKKHY